MLSWKGKRQVQKLEGTPFRVVGLKKVGGQISVGKRVERTGWIRAAQRGGAPRLSAIARGI